MLNLERAIILAPHTDDGEFGCGGTIARLMENGVAVYYIAFSICETSVPDGFPRDILATEVQEATQVLGIRPEYLIVHRFPVRCFPQYRQEILEELVKIQREINPDLVFLPASDDIHQDHQTMSQEGLRAFKHTSILGYEMPWNNLTFAISTLVHLEERHLEKKIGALRRYRSQQHRNYMAESLVKNLSRVRGLQAGVEYAEAFQAIRWVIK